MKNITWDMAEQFTFPVGLGAIEDVVSVKVTPKWEQSDDGQSIRLSGIYHIVASIQFNPVQQVEQVDGTYIEHIDLEHSTGYFEYALPLEVDLPSNKVEGPIKLEVSEIKSSNDTASCQFVWQVQCDFAGQQTALDQDVEKPQVVHQESVKQEVAKQEKVEQEPVQEVAQQEKVEQQPEQEVAQQEKVEQKPEQEVAQQEKVEQEPAQEVAQREKVEQQPVQEVAQQEKVEQEPVQEVAQQETVEQKPAQEVAQQEPKKEKVTSQVAQRIVAQRENVQHEPVATQESSFKQPAAQKTPLQDDFFVELTDSYSVYNAKLNKIRS